MWRHKETRALTDIWTCIRENGESGAERLVSEYGDRLFAAAVLLCRNDHDAEELVFRTFDRAIRKIGSYEPNGDFFNWLYTIMLNFRRMDLRKKRVELVPMGADSDLPEIPDTVFAELLSDTEGEAIMEAVRGLQDQLREVVMMRYFAERPVEEIAAVLSIPEGTVKSRLFKARSVLFACLSGKGRKEINDERK